MTRSVDLLIVAAFAPELAALASIVPVNGEARVSERLIATRSIGVGLTRASAGLARTLLEVSPREVLLIGSCGAYPGRGIETGAIVVAQSIAIGDAACLEGRAEIPGLVTTERGCDTRLVDSLEARRVRVANTLAITTDDDLAARYASAGFDIEHLEAFALDTVPAGIPCGALLAVANQVGRGAREEWKANAARAHAALSIVGTLLA